MTTPTSNSKGTPDFIEPVTGDETIGGSAKPVTRSPFSIKRGTTDIPGGSTGTTTKDTPPKRSRKGGTGTAGTAKPTASTVDYQPGVITQGLESFYGQIGMVVGMFDSHCGTVILQNTQPMAASMEAWAKESPSARSFLNKLVTTSVIGQVIAAHTPIVMAIAMHHVPAIRNKFNPPEPVNGDSGVGPNVKVA